MHWVNAVATGIQRLVRLSKRGVSIRPRKSLFSTAKYRPEFPAKGFTDLDAARAWAIGFVRWYNVEHRHSGIRYVSPAQGHAGDGHAILVARHALYFNARALNPARWARRATGRTSARHPSIPNATARRIRRASGFGL